MGPTYMLIVDLDPYACPEGSSERFVRLLRGSPSTKTIEVQTTTHFPPEKTLSASPDLILLRSPLAKDLPEMVRFLRRRWRAAPILGLFCSEEETPADVSQALRYGLDDFLACPLRNIDVFPRMQRFLQEQGKTIPLPRSGEMQATPHVEGLVGESDVFLQVIHKLREVARSDATVLISGETGTGKELIARAIHYHSPRQGKPFIPVDCGALPDHLVENELFGHVKGAYTDASSPQKGLVAEAETGTLFLDDVDTLNPSAQAKLLRFLQEREYRPLGSSKSKTADVRIIAATNTDLQQRVQTQRFREDLYYRLNITALRLPSLRERPEDIPLLVVHFLCRYGNRYRRESLQLSADALHKLMAYPWPGNIRELETVIQRTVILASSPVLEQEDIDLPLPYQSEVSESGTFHEAKAQVIEQFERAYLSHLLAAYGGNITRAAQCAGIKRRSLQRLLHKYGMHRSTFQT